MAGLSGVARARAVWTAIPLGSPASSISTSGAGAEGSDFSFGPEAEQRRKPEMLPRLSW
jgi:hypothetical protein